MNCLSRFQTRKCRNLLIPSRVRRQGMAEKLDKQWIDLRQHATIERDPRKLSELTAELDKRKQLKAAANRPTEI